MENLLFYDVEVFKNDSLIVLKDAEGNTVAALWSNPERKVAEDPSGFEGIDSIIDGKTLCGFNNYHYDDYIIKAMRHPVNSMTKYIKKRNDSIINCGGVNDRIEDKDITSIDVFQQIGNPAASLKLIEGNMGVSIVETSVPFDIDRPLTQEERDEVRKYCEWDVQNTIAVYNLRKASYFDIKGHLLDMLPDDYNRWAYNRVNTTTISAKILLGSGKLDRWNKDKAKSTLSKFIAWGGHGIPQEVWEMWDAALETEETVTAKGIKKTIDAYGCKFVFGMGGLHGAPSKPGVWHNIKLADVGSMYPSMIVMTEVLGPATEKYDGLRKERLAIKHKDKVKADALKLVLNSVYGNLKQKYSSLYCPHASATICILGQVALFTLCGMLHEAGYELINANTDGIAFVDNPELGEKYNDICRAWEEQFNGMLLEVDEFDGWIQKDVNNYVATNGSKIKTKGGDTNKAFQNRFFDNNNCRIVHMALVEALVARIHNPNSDTERIIRECVEKHEDEKLLFQYVLKAGGTYKGVVDQNGKEQNKVNRLFATPDGEDKLYKVRQDDGLVNFPDVPEHSTLWNDDVTKFTGDIDIYHYIKLTISKAKGWGLCM